MNHYERLKVSQDAPPEVIRAAYRALATKLHPDRQGAATGPEDVMHEQMAALNMAYEVLIDPKLRQDYDATLAPAHARVQAQEGAAYADQADQGPSTRVDMDWLPPKPASAPTFWPPSRQMTIVGGGAVALLVLAAAAAFWQMSGQQQMEKALSDQYARHADQQAGRADQVPVVAAGSIAGKSSISDGEQSPSAAPPVTGRRKPTVAELSRMSDEELMKVLPTLDNDDGLAAPAARMAGGTSRGRVQHPLDGKPLNLRVDTQLIDPLAPELPPAKGRAKP